MINRTSLEKCMHQLGDNHSDITALKRFFNAHYAIKISDIPSNHNFCAKAQTALAQFQAHKRLNSTARMNVETWQAIGEELGAINFEASFGNSPNIKSLRSAAFSNKIRKMFPTTTHTELIEYAFKDGIKDGGLSAFEVKHIDDGSKLTDTHFGTGEWYDIPITLIVSEAPKHAMTPEGMPVAEAMKAAYKWIDDNVVEAREIQRKLDTARRELEERKKQTPELGYLQRVPVLMSSTALEAFGKACHTYMNSVSPAHHGWQEYKISKTRSYYEDPNEPGSIKFSETEDSVSLIKFALESWAHKKSESAPPTQEQRDECALYMRGAFLTTFGNKWFKKAVKSESEREKVYTFIKAKGSFWEEDLAPSNTRDVRDSPLPMKPHDKNFKEPGMGVVHYT